jgi:hypothetical protein
MLRSHSNPVCDLFILSGSFELISTPTRVGSTDPDGLLTFKFDASASDWDNSVYMEIVKKLVDALNVKDGKSILECVAHSLQ